MKVVTLQNIQALAAASERLPATVVFCSVLGGILVAVALLLTARKNRRRPQLEASQRRSLSTADVAHDAVLTFDPDTLRFIFVNEGAVQQLGYQREELLKMKPWHLEPQISESGYRARIAPLLNGRLDSQTSSTTYRRKDGLDVQVEIILQSSKAPDGQSVLVAIVRDVTGRRFEENRRLYQERLEQHVLQRTNELAETVTRLSREITQRQAIEQILRESQARLRKQAQLLDLAHDAIFVRDSNDRLTFWNPAAERQYGWSQEEALGKHTHTFLQTIFPKPLEEIAASLLRTGYWEGELKRTTRSGTQIVVASRWSLERDEEGNFGETLEINNDITELKAIEYLRLENVRLEERGRQVEESNRLKSEFLATMSHELRTPLNGIIGFTEILIDRRPGPLTAKQLEYLTDVHNSSVHLLQLINDVLDLAKIEAGKMELGLDTFTLETAIGEVCAVLQGIADARGINLTWSVIPQLGSVTLDPQLFKHICYNLLSNALKFTNSGGKVELSASSRPDRWLELSVVDTGIGIRQEDIPRLFRQFQQLESGTSRRYEGTGLGLALTRKIVELHGGRIEVESEFGRGSRFTVVLPFVPGQDTVAVAD